VTSRCVVEDEWEGEERQAATNMELRLRSPSFDYAKNASLSTLTPLSALIGGWGMGWNGVYWFVVGLKSDLRLGLAVCEKTVHFVRFVRSGVSIQVILRHSRC